MLPLGRKVAPGVAADQAVSLSRASSWRVESPNRNSTSCRISRAWRRVGRRSARSWRWPQQGTPAAGNFGADGDRVEQLTRGQAHASRRRAGLRPHGERRPRRRGGAAHHLGLPHRRRAGAAVRRPPRSQVGRAAGNVAAPPRHRARPRAAGRLRLAGGQRRALPLLAPNYPRGKRPSSTHATSTRGDDCSAPTSSHPAATGSGYSAMLRTARDGRGSRLGAGAVTARVAGRNPHRPARVGAARPRRSRPRPRRPRHSRLALASPRSAALDPGARWRLAPAEARSRDGSFAAQDPPESSSRKAVGWPCDVPALALLASVAPPQTSAGQSLPAPTFGRRGVSTARRSARNASVRSRPCPRPYRATRPTARARGRPWRAFPRAWLSRLGTSLSRRAAC